MKISCQPVSPRQGSTLLPALVAVVSLSAVAAGVFALSLTHTEEVAFNGHEVRALYVAEAGVAETAMRVATAVDAGDPVPAALGTEQQPMAVSGGGYVSTIVDNGDDSYTLRVTGTVSGHRRTLEGRLDPGGDSAFQHAIFAGNSSGDPNYAFSLGGTGNSADQISGDIYSGGGIEITGDAELLGDAYASGYIEREGEAPIGPGDSEELPGAYNATAGVDRPLLDLDAMDYVNNNDVDVAAVFAASGYSSYHALGGTAEQVPEDSPAHIFRLNPSDRPTEISSTAKDDYFLEDPYEAATSFSAVFGRGHEVTLSGVDGELGPNGNELVYYIDGNLWIHNAPMGGMRFESEGAGVHLTFVISGNLYVSDDVMLDNENLDGVAFITLVDPAVADSGNIYFGDPRWGTLELMNAFMYAENNFYDNNLDKSGSREVVLNGIMTAGNQVAIERDFVKRDGSVAHSRLEVNYDDRIASGQLSLPGLPNAQAGAGGLRLAYWREITEN
ncbi:MAG: hypothetical protein AAFZ65_08575 [Planctomycetota bacterium]